MYHQLLALEEFCHVQASELKKKICRPTLSQVFGINHPIPQRAVQDSISIDIELQQTTCSGLYNDKIFSLRL